MKNYSYAYPRPGVTSDIVLFAYKDNRLKTLLIQRGQEPFINMWAFPGGFIEENETAEQAAYRELEEETSLSNIKLTPLFFDSNLNRDPRGWTISEVYYGFIPYGESSEKAGDDAAQTKWFEINNLPDFAFDHKLIAEKALEHLKELTLFKVFGSEILPKEFDIIHLLQIYLSVLKDDSFVKKLVKKLIEKEIIILIEEEKSLFSFNKLKIDELNKNGLYFI